MIDDSDALSKKKKEFDAKLQKNPPWKYQGDD
jgi:hypothetical protein